MDAEEGSDGHGPFVHQDDLRLVRPSIRRSGGRSRGYEEDRSGHRRRVIATLARHDGQNSSLFNVKTRSIEPLLVSETYAFGNVVRQLALQYTQAGNFGMVIQWILSATAAKNSRSNTRPSQFMGSSPSFMTWLRSLARFRP